MTNGIQHDSDFFWQTLDRFWVQLGRGLPVIILFRVFDLHYSGHSAHSDGISSAWDVGRTMAGWTWIISDDVLWIHERISPPKHLANPYREHLNALTNK